jgi:hypothetical protein
VRILSLAMPGCNLLRSAQGTARPAIASHSHHLNKQR